jgi:hypothetical protein
VIRGLAALPDLGLLDRLIRSRFWIGLVAVSLIGIVAMQVAVLKLNTGIGRAIEHVSTLQRDSASLQADVSQLSSGDRIEAEGYRMGMVMAPVGNVRFLTAGRWDAARASRRIQPPAAGLTSGALATSSTSSTSSSSSTASGASSSSGGTSTTTVGVSPGASAGAPGAVPGPTSAPTSAADSPTGSATTAGTGGATGATAAATGTGTDTGGGTGTPLAAAAVPSGR